MTVAELIKNLDALVAADSGAAIGEHNPLPLECIQSVTRFSLGTPVDFGDLSTAAVQEIPLTFTMVDGVVVVTASE